MRLGPVGAGLLLLALAGASAGPDDVLERESRLGPVLAQVRISPRTPLIGDAVILEIEVAAEASVELLMPEFGESLARFAIVDFVPSERVDADGRTVATQRYTLQPSRSGLQSIPPIAIEFIDRRPGETPAPDGEDAYELLTERLEFEVQSVLPEDAALELQSPKPKLPPLGSPGRPIWPYGLALLVALATLSPFLLRRWLAYRARAARASAYEVARAALDELLYGPRAGPEEMDAFFVKLSSIVRHYLESRFELRSPEQTTEEFLEEITRSPDVSRGHQQLLQRFLQRADLVKFAHYRPDSQDVDESVDAARRFLEETRNDAAGLAHG